MKKIFLFISTLLVMRGSTAQGIFNQDGEMLKKTIQQIVLLTTYGQYVKQGYRIMDGGLHTIQGIKNGELNLHRDYIHSLKAVNPKIKGKQVAIQSLADALISGCSLLKQDATKAALLNKQEVAYIKSTIQGFLEEMSKELEGLNLLVTDEKLSMTDDERMEHIDRLYDRMVNTCQSFKCLDRDARKIIAGRKEILEHNRELKEWWGISNAPHP